MPTVSLAAADSTGRRRRPSGEPPPLPRPVDRIVVWYAAALVMLAGLEVAVANRASLAALTAFDATTARGLSAIRTAWVTRIAADIDSALTGPVLLAVAWATIALLALARRPRHLVAYLVIWLGVSSLAAALASALGRPRPTGVVILAPWHGYAHPSRPVTALAMVLAGLLYTLVPAGSRRRRYRWFAGALLLLVCFARLYLGVDGLTDTVAGLALGWAAPVVAYRLTVPDRLFPVRYRPRRGAHLDITGEREHAIKRALADQLGLDVEHLEPFGLTGSAGSTPLRLHCRSSDGHSYFLFGKLYALTHLRADRWYKLARTVLYGRLEDEKPFSTVRRLVMYEDHLLRLLRDAGLPTPAPHGVVEITPEREYVVVMEFFAGAGELGSAVLSDAQIDDGLRIIRRLWNAGVAHRDIKPSNLLVRSDQVLLIDVAFASLRPTPWRQAVDLADMMLTLALASDPDRVYSRALVQFAPEDVAEAFAATRSIALPMQLRGKLRSCKVDLIARFRELAPARKPVRIQLWSLRRVAATTGLVILAAVVLMSAGLYVQLAGLAGAAGTTDRATAPRCTDAQRLALVAQSVPAASYLPCLVALPQGWTAGDATIRRGITQFRLYSDRSPGHPVLVTLSTGRPAHPGTPTTPRAIGVETYVRLAAISPRYAGSMVDTFPGGSVTYRFDFERGPHIALMEELSSAVSLRYRPDLERTFHQQLRVELDP